MSIDVKGDTLIQILKEPSTIAIIQKKTPQLPYAEQTRTWCHPHYTKIESLFALDWPVNDSTLYGDYLCYVIFNNHFVKFTNKN